MKRFTARQLHNNPSAVYRNACRAPIKITHQSFGDMVLISPDSIFSTHRHVDGTVIIHLRSLPDEIIQDVASNDSKPENDAA